MSGINRVHQVLCVCHRSDFRRIIKYQFFLVIGSNKCFTFSKNKNGDIETFEVS